MIIRYWIDVYVNHDDNGSVSLFQASVRTYEMQAGGAATEMRLPGGFGEGKTLFGSVKAAMRNLEKALGSMRER